jgi:glycine hydroxymethyltransferase
LPLFETPRGITDSHQLALRAAPLGGGQTAAARLRQANILSSGIGLPIDPVPGDLPGLRFGTPEIVRLGMTAGDMPELAALVAEALTGDAANVAPRTTAFRREFHGLHFIRQ